MSHENYCMITRLLNVIKDDANVVMNTSDMTRILMGKYLYTVTKNRDEVKVFIDHINDPGYIVVYAHRIVHFTNSQLHNLDAPAVQGSINLTEWQFSVNGIVKRKRFVGGSHDKVTRTLFTGEIMRIK